MQLLMIFLSIFFLFNSQIFSRSEMLRQVWDFPVNNIKANTIYTYDIGKVRVEEVYYLSRSYRRKPIRIFGYFCYPLARSGKLPAILLSHGGGGAASRERAASWADRGYAVLAIDLPGKGENRFVSRSSGPDMDVPNLMQTGPNPTYNYLIYAVAATRSGITYLAQRKEVDPDRIGMIGLSWGGVLTLLTNGQDKRLKAAVNVFGAGYIPEGCTWQDYFSVMNAEERETWDLYLDPKNFLATQHAPILFVTGTNDHCYYLPTFQKSYRQVRTEKRVYLIPNLKHKFLASAQSPALAWLDQHLKAGGKFPELSVGAPFLKDKEKFIIPVRAKACGSLESASLYYCEGGPQRWTVKTWKEILPYRERGVYYFPVPTALLKPEILFYVNVKDDRGGVSSSLVQCLFKVKLKNGSDSFACSAPIMKVWRREPPFTMLPSL